jgi:putative ABC transport system permease protein
MKWLPLVWGSLMRRKVRTLFTVLSITVAFLLFGLLAALRLALSFGVELAGTDTLMMFQKVSLAQPLPLAYRAQIAATPGVAGVTHATWFGGVYQDQKNWFPQMAVEATTFLAMHPDYRLPADQRQAWLAQRTGCIVGRDVARRFGWKVGDRIPLQGGSWRRPDGASWVFTIDGIFDAGRPGADLSQMFFHYEYLNESRSIGRDTVGWYVIRVTDPARAAEVASRLDALFVNSADATKTATTKAFLQAWASQIGDVGAIVLAVVGTVVFTMLLVTGNTMAQSTRERRAELAVLKVIGFTDGRVLGLILLESVGLAISGGALGLGLAWAIVARGDPTGGLLPAFYLPARDVAAGIALVLGLGLVAGALPAWQAGRLRIVDALRR